MFIKPTEWFYFEFEIKSNRNNSIPVQKKKRNMKIKSTNLTRNYLTFKSMQKYSFLSFNSSDLYGRKEYFLFTNLLI